MDMIYQIRRAMPYMPEFDDDAKKRAYRFYDDETIERLKKYYKTNDLDAILKIIKTHGISGDLEE